MLTLPQLRSLLAGFICMVIYGSSYTYGTIVPYATSYIYHQGNLDISASQMALLLPVSIVVLNLGMPMTNIQFLQFTNRKTALISLLGISLCVFVMSFGTQFWNYVVVYGIVFGIFMGYGYMSPIKNCYQHIPARKGLCSGVCILGMGISSLVFNQILIAIINPNNQSAFSLDDGRKIYPRTVADNLPKALMIMSGVYLTLGLIGVALMVPPTSIAANQQQSGAEDDNRGQAQSKESQVMNQMPKQDELQRSLLSEQRDDPYTFAYLTGKKIHMELLTLLFSVPFGIFIAFNYKEYGLTKITGDAFLTNVGSAGALFNGFGRLFFGVMFDRFSFKVVSSIINAGLLVFAITIPYLLEVQWMFMVGICAIYFCYGGNYAVYPTHTVRIFGAEVGSKLYFIPFFGFTMGSIIQLAFRWMFVSEDNKFQGFKLCFYIFAGFNLISLLLSIFIKYDYLDMTKSIHKLNEKQQQNLNK